MGVLIVLVAASAVLVAFLLLVFLDPGSVLRLRERGHERRQISKR
jgi:hypothetical protein